MKTNVRARLMDRLQEDVCLPPLPRGDNYVSELAVMAHTDKVRTALTGAKVIEATNVARFFDEAYVEARDGDAVWSDLKCLVPPHPKFFIEWEQPLVPALRMGVLFAASTPDTMADTLRSLMGGRAYSPAEMQRIRDAVVNERTRWVYLTLSFLEFTANPDHISNLRGPYHVGSAAVSDDGALLSFSMIRQNESLPPEEEAQVGAASLVAWTTLAMMNCENIDTVEAAPAPAAFQKARAKRGRKPLVSYHTVRVDMTKTPRSISRTPLPGDSSTRLHEKRGHMKDYRKGKGLFGKYRGLWYWGPQLAGSGDEGVVISDYEVK